MSESDGSSFSSLSENSFSSVGSSKSSDGEFAGCYDFEPEYTEEEMAKLEPINTENNTKHNTLKNAFANMTSKNAPFFTVETKNENIQIVLFQ